MADLEQAQNEQVGVPWWHGAALYQCYIRSWRDTNGDGFGDLAGVRQGLDYLAWLGVDGVWLSPTMPSPDDDWGYDVADYRAVHPELGTLEDLDALITAADGLGMRILLDLVPNHTSSEHAWFVDACSGRDARHRDYYVWSEPGAGGGPPNNWRDHTGRSAWTFDEHSGQYYLHNFLESQPDLNWWNPAVHKEFEEILGFWFDRGVAGFRIDVAHGLYKDAELRDDPPADPTDRRGRDGILPVYSANRPEVHDVYRRWRQFADEQRPPRLLLGETWVLELDRLAAFYGKNDELHLGFNFPFTLASFDATSLKGVVRSTIEALPDGACPVWMMSNHDISRAATRWAQGDESIARSALVLLLTLPGTVVLYYGDELAMEDVVVERDRQRDPMTWDTPEKFQRDGARTPMPWDDSPNLGFTTDEVEPWLPFGPTARAVSLQRGSAGSPLELTRALLALRRSSLSGVTGPYEELDSPPGTWLYRSGPLRVAVNFRAEQVAVSGLHESIACSSAERRSPHAHDGRTTLAAQEAIVTRTA